MKKVLITGGGSGLGEAFAELYAAQGDEVCIADMNSDNGNAVAAKINAAGGNAFFQQCDITQQWDVDKLSLRLAEKWQSVDVLINNAGVATAGTIDFETIEQWQWVMEINVLGQVRMTKAILPLLRKSDSTARAIINISSQAGITPMSGMGSYCASKAAVVNFSETLHLELAPEGIHVSAVCPAFFDTNLNTSLRTDQPGMDKLVEKMVKKSGVSAAQIAAQTVAQVTAKKFLVVTHKSGRTAYRLRRYLPIERYLAMVKKRLSKYASKKS